MLRWVPRQGTKLFSEIMGIRRARGEEPPNVAVKNERVDLGWFEGASQYSSWRRFNFSASFDLLNLSTGTYVVLVGLYEEPREGVEKSTKAARRLPRPITYTLRDQDPGLGLLDWGSPVLLRKD